MDICQYFAMQQDVIDGLELKGIVLPGLSDDDLRRHPTGQNSIAWLLWHTARAQDVLAHAWVGGVAQVYDSEGFAERLAAGTRALGTGMSFDEAVSLSQSVDLGALRAYWDAVAASTIKVFSGLSSAALDEIVEDEIRMASAPDGLYDNPTAMYLNDLLKDKTRAWYISFLPIHASEHLVGEALSVRGQLGLSAGI